jgi:hypothetical protein
VVSSAESSEEHQEYCVRWHDMTSAQAAEFVVERYERDDLIVGRCPSCGHSMTAPLFDEVFRARRFPWRRETQTPAGDPGIPMVCTCEGDQHPGRPENLSFGCGAYWALERPGSS